MNNSQEEEEEEEGEGGKEGGKEGPGQVYWESEAFAVSRVMVVSAEDYLQSLSSIPPSLPPSRYHFISWASSVSPSLPPSFLPSFPQEQRFTLSRPAFFLGGEIVLVLEGKQQRQTLSKQGGRPEGWREGGREGGLKDRL